MLDTSIHVKTEQFDGPLGLLLMLIQKEQMDIREFEMTSITRQYLKYLDQMRDLNFDVAGEYLYLAATLLLLKSKSCLTEEEMKDLEAQFEGDTLNITSQSELVRRLEELHHFQKMSTKLWDLPKKGHEVFVRPKVNRKEIINSILTPVEIDKLITAFMDFLQKQRKQFTVVKRDRLSIEEKLKNLKSLLNEGDQWEFSELLRKDDSDKAKENSLQNTVITFISLLELVRLKRLGIFQNKESGEIFVKVIKGLTDFDVNSADGFEAEENQVIQ